MTIFLTLLLKLLPIYLILFLGFIAGKFLQAQSKPVAKILIYFLVPIIAFNAATTNLDLNLILLPILIFLLAVLICFLAYQISSIFYKDNHKNLIAFASGYGNFGFFALPVAISLFGNQVTSLVVFIGLGLQFFQDTVGYFLISKGKYSVKDSFLKLATYPSIYAIFLGIIINLLNFNLNNFEIYTTFVGYSLGAFVFLGTFIVGIGIGGVKKLNFDFKFLFLIFIFKFLIWPLLAFALIWLDRNFIKLYEPQTHTVFFFMSIIPLASNVVAFAADNDLEPDKASLAVFLSYLLALIYIPLMVLFLGF